jgi:hypothetical protein
MKLHYFFIENDILKVIKDMPEEPKYGKWFYDDYDNMQKSIAHQTALKSAKEKAIEVDNKDDVLNRLYDYHYRPSVKVYPLTLEEWKALRSDTIYSLDCNIEVNNHCTNKHYISGCANETCWDLEECQAKVQLALITFSESKPMNEGKEVPIVWARCLNCEARNHPQNTKCDECGSSSLENENLVKKSIPPLPVEDKEEQKKLWKLALHHAGSRMDFMKFLTDQFIILPRKQLE